MITAAGNCSAPSEDYQYYLYPTVYSLVLALGLPGNLGALYVFIFKITPRTSSNVYIINLALADTAILCTLPFRIHYHLHGNDWAFGDVACRVTGTLFHANIYMSTLFMSCICVDRYIATAHPYTYLRLRDSRCTVLVSVTAWVVSGTAMLCFMLAGPLGSKSRLKQRRCFENFTEQEWDRRMARYSIVTLIGSVLSSVVILVCYPLVAKRIALIRNDAARGALRVIYTIIAITLLCFLPFHLIHFLLLLYRMGVIRHCPSADVIYHGRRVAMALVSLNSCLDPLLYYVITSHCKLDLSKVKNIMARRNRGVYTIDVS